MNAKNMKNVRGIQGEIEGETQDTNTRNTIHVRICSAWFERPSPIESQGKDLEGRVPCKRSEDHGVKSKVARRNSNKVESQGRDLAVLGSATRRDAVSRRSLLTV